METVDFKAKRDALDQMLRQGQLALVREELKAIAKVPREFLADFAHLALRSGLSSISLRLLQKVIRPKAPLQVPATSREKAIYASALADFGALSEAQSILRPLENDPTPEVQLNLGFINVYQWNYEAAIPFFQRYLRLTGPTDYQKAIARVNLAAALSFCDHVDQLIPLVTETVDICTRNDWAVLTVESHLIATQGYISTSAWDQGRESLRLATEIAKGKGLDDFYLRKWKLLLELRQNGATKELLTQLSNLKAAALKRGAKETVRECDYYRGLLTRSSTLMNKTFFGTPYPSYRRRLLRETQDWLRLSKRYTWEVEGAESEKAEAVTIDLTNERIGETALASRNGLMPVLRAMSSDFYRPLKLGDLFTRLYPGEMFNPFSSPGRVRTALSRARQMLEEKKIDLEIVCVDNEYHLRAGKPCEILVSASYESEEPKVDSTALRRLKAAWPYKAFSTQQAAEVLDLPIEKTREVLKLASDEKKIIRIGAGRSTLFRLAK